MSKMRLPKLIGVAILLATSGTHAQEQSFRPLSYDFLFASAAMTDIDSGGIEIGGSVSVTETIHVFGGYQDWEIGDNADRSILQLGAGYRWGISPNVDMLVRLALADSDFDRRGRGPQDDDGLIISGLVRGWVASQIELSGELLLDDSLGSDMDVVLEFGGQYHLKDNFSLGGRIRADEDDMALFLGVRFYFRGSSQ